MVCPPKVDSQKLVAKVNASQVVCVRTYILEIVCVRTYISKKVTYDFGLRMSSTWVFRNIRESVPPSLRALVVPHSGFDGMTSVAQAFGLTTCQ